MPCACVYNISPIEWLGRSFVVEVPGVTFWCAYSISTLFGPYSHTVNQDQTKMNTILSLNLLLQIMEQQLMSNSKCYLKVKNTLLNEEGTYHYHKPDYLHNSSGS